MSFIIIFSIIAVLALILAIAGFSAVQERKYLKAVFYFYGAMSYLVIILSKNIVAAVLILNVTGYLLAISALIIAALLAFSFVTAFAANYKKANEKPVLLIAQ